MSDPVTLTYYEKHKDELDRAFFENVAKSRFVVLMEHLNGGDATVAIYTIGTLTNYLDQLTALRAEAERLRAVRDAAIPALSYLYGCFATTEIASSRPPRVRALPPAVTALEAALRAALTTTGV